MSLDKLVDSTQLNSDLTSVADAIRAKSGGSGQLAFPAGFVSEIGNISSSPAWVNYVSGIRVESKTLPASIDMYLPNATDFYHAFWNCSSCNLIKIKTDKKITTLQQAFNVSSWTGSRKIVIDADLSGCTNYDDAFHQRAGGDYAYTIEANLDFSSVTTNNNARAFGANSAIRNVTFVPNTLKVNFLMSSASALTTASLISLANCLRAVSGKTLALHSTPKAACSTIMGTVTNNGTYDLFTQDDQGTVSLQSFITSTKGWTLA